MATSDELKALLDQMPDPDDRDMYNGEVDKQKIEEAVAKATYVKSKKVWKVYWQRADLKWHRYDPHPEVNSIEEFLDVVERDEHCCFYG